MQPNHFKKCIKLEEHVEWHNKDTNPECGNFYKTIQFLQQMNGIEKKKVCFLERKWVMTTYKKFKTLITLMEVLALLHDLNKLSNDVLGDRRKQNTPCLLEEILLILLVRMVLQTLVFIIQDWLIVDFLYLNQL